MTDFEDKETPYEFNKKEEQCFSVKLKNCPLSEDDHTPVCCGWAIKIDDNWTTIPWCAYAKGLEKFECSYPQKAVDVNLEEIAKKFAPKLQDLMAKRLITELNEAMTALHSFRESKNWDIYWSAYNWIEKLAKDLIKSQYGVTVGGENGLKILKQQDKMVGPDGKLKNPAEDYS